uniref:Uncharacterized protein n=1 Tax=Spongospora subterranea TaxID=70186 RepID=A0A0H5R6I0_9EUKA|eukprot:CRZ09372.1 hypothetical protein [Spongospora subterranea]
MMGWVFGSREETLQMSIFPVPMFLDSPWYPLSNSVMACISPQSQPVLSSLAAPIQLVSDSPRSVCKNAAKTSIHRALPLAKPHFISQCCRSSDSASCADSFHNLSDNDNRNTDSFDTNTTYAPQPYGLPESTSYAASQLTAVAAIFMTSTTYVVHQTCPIPVVSPSSPKLQPSHSSSLSSSPIQSPSTAFHRFRNPTKS